MGAILEQQRVAKRRRNTKLKNMTGYTPQFSQTVRKKPEKNPFKQPTRKAAKKDKLPGFTFNLPVLPILAVSAGAFVISLAAFNWENISISLPNNLAFAPAIETEAERHTLEYAATGLPLIGTEQGQSGDRAEGQSSVREGTEQGQSDLIAFEWHQYKVKKGDSVSSIAQKFSVSVGAVIASNDIRNARTLREGQSLRIPNIDGIPHQVKNGDSLSKIAVSYNVPLEVILDVNDIRSDNIKQGETLFIPGARMNDIDLRMSLGELFMYPVTSRRITSRYGMRKDPISGALAFHTGIDISVNTGTPVAASLDGVVSVVAENWLYGKYIIITHDNGYKTLYAHLNAFSVKQGDRVTRGRKIAESGNTGYSTGPHLHFSIYDKNSKLVNPLELLR